MIDHTSTLSVTTPSDVEVRVTRVFDAPRRLVFEALTTPSILMRWMHGPNGWTLAVCDVDLRVGGAFRYVWRKPNGREMGAGGVFRVVEAPGRLVHTELFDEDWTGGEAEVTTELEERDGGTTLIVTMRYASKAGRDAALSTNFTAGMEASYDALAACAGGLTAARRTVRPTARPVRQNSPAPAGGAHVSSSSDKPAATRSVHVCLQCRFVDGDRAARSRWPRPPRRRIRRPAPVPISCRSSCLRSWRSAVSTRPARASPRACRSGRA